MAEWLEQFGMVFLVAMAPLAELRGAIPLGVMMGLEPWLVWLVSVIGNMVPVPFIILFIRRIFRWMERQSGRLAQLVRRMEQEGMRYPLHLGVTEAGEGEDARQGIARLFKGPPGAGVFHRQVGPGGFCAA